MAGIQIADAKAPWIMFERRAVEDRNESIAQGHFVAKDVDFVLVTPHGSKDQIEREVQDWFTNMEQQVREQRLDPSWLSAYKQAYKNWLEGKETPVEGTSILNWPLISPAQVKLLQDLHILTVESLAEANEEAIRRMGMGSRVLVQKAQEYLKQAKDHGKSVEEVVDLRGRVQSLEQTVKDQADLIRMLRAQLPDNPGQVAAPPATPFSGTGISRDDLGLGTKL